GTFYQALTGRRYVSIKEYKTTKEYILQAINVRWRVKITEASKKGELATGLYLIDDVLNGALMHNIGRSRAL
ncbi:hypothetical protein JNP55_003917, partial [Salmonella enterica]|nr:hypothetical protein [Salmonella enterica]